LLTLQDIRTRFVIHLHAAADRLSAYLVDQLSLGTKELLSKFDESSDPTEALLQGLQRDLNKRMKEGGLYDTERFENVKLSARTKELIKKNPQGLDLVDLNRWLLEEAYIDGIAPKTPFPDVESYYVEQMVKLINSKAPFAKQVHGRITIEDKTNPDLDKRDRWRLNNLFDDPPLLMEALVKGGYINVERPRSSRFFELLEFNGPMYKVFTEEEKGIILDWIESIRDSEPNVVLPEPTPTYPSDPALAMKKLIEKYKERASATPSHDAFSLTNEMGVTKKVREWFEAPAVDVMAALRSTPRWIVPGSVEKSAFFKDVVGAGGLMAAVGFEDYEIQIMKNWVADGARIPVAQMPPGSFVAESGDLAETRADELNEIPVIRPITFAERRHQLGMGSVH
jgi:hypothetical protein